MGASLFKGQEANQEMLNRAKVILVLQALCFVSLSWDTVSNFCCTSTKAQLTMFHYVQLCYRAIHTRDLARLLCTLMGMHTSLMTVNGKDLLNLSTCRRTRNQDSAGTTLMRISADFLSKGLSTGLVQLSDCIQS